MQSDTLLWYEVGGWVNLPHIYFSGYRPCDQSLSPQPIIIIIIIIIIINQHPKSTNQEQKAHKPLRTS